MQSDRQQGIFLTKTDMPLAIKDKLQLITKNINEDLKEADKKWTHAALLLKKIRDEKIWKDSYGSFREYIDKEFGKQPSWAYKQMRAMSAVQQLTEGDRVQLDTPHFETVSRSAAEKLAILTPEKRIEVVRAITDAGKEVTAKAVTEVTKALPKKPAPVEDIMGTIIPPEALGIWNRRDEIQEMMSQISSMRCYIEAKRKEGDVLYNGINTNCIAKLHLVYAELRSAHPEVVCGSCEGTVPKTGCGSCNSTGFQSQTDYERLTPLGDRNIRKADIQERKDNAVKRLPAGVSRLHT